MADKNMQGTPKKDPNFTMQPNPHINRPGAVARGIAERASEVQAERAASLRQHNEDMDRLNQMSNRGNTRGRSRG